MEVAARCCGWRAQAGANLDAGVLQLLRKLGAQGVDDQAGQVLLRLWVCEEVLRTLHQARAGLARGLLQSDGAQRGRRLVLDGGTGRCGHERDRAQHVGWLSACVIPAGTITYTEDQQHRGQDEGVLGPHGWSLFRA